MKIQVIARSFYEDAYIDYFLYYYIKMGFDRIVIFKVDKEIFGEYKLPDNLEPYKDKIIIKYLPNLANNLFRHEETIKYYGDTDYDYTLNIDIDEFIVINQNISSSIHDYLNYMINKFGNIDCIYFRWICVNKTDSKWPDNKLYTLKDYINNYQLEAYKYCKSLYKTSLVTSIKIMENHYILKRGINLYIDGHKYSRYCNVRVLSSASKNINCCHGYILHVNMRSYTNSLTKALVTKLRDIKMIRDLDKFRHLINNTKLDNISTDKIINIRKQFNHLLNHKYKFLLQNRYFKKRMIKYYDYNMIKKQLLHSNYEELISKPFIDVDKEWDILKTICETKKINYEKLKKILHLIF